MLKAFPWSVDAKGQSDIMKEHILFDSFIPDSLVIRDIRKSLSNDSLFPIYFWFLFLSFYIIIRVHDTHYWFVSNFRSRFSFFKIKSLFSFKSTRVVVNNNRSASDSRNVTPSFAWFGRKERTITILSFSNTWSKVIIESRQDRHQDILNNLKWVSWCLLLHAQELSMHEVSVSKIFLGSALTRLSFSLTFSSLFSHLRPTLSLYGLLIEVPFFFRPWIKLIIERDTTVLSNNLIHSQSNQ